MGIIAITIYLLLILLWAGPLIIFHDYLIHFFRYRSWAKKLDPSLKPALDVPIIYVFIFITFPFSVMFGIPAIIGMDWPAQASEARMNLIAIYENERIYHDKYGDYAGGADAFKLINWDPEGNNLYQYFLGEDTIKNRRRSHYDYHPQGAWPFTISPEVSEDGFTAMAMGNLDNDECPDVWTINESKELIHIVDDWHDVYRKGTCYACPWASEKSGLGEALAPWESEIESAGLICWLFFPIDIILMLWVFVRLAWPEYGKYKRLKALIKVRGREL